MFYSMVPILALVILFITNFDILFNKKYPANNPKALRAYRFFLAATFAFYIIDTGWGFSDGLEDKTLVTVVTNLYFVAIAILLFFWSMFVARFVDGFKRFKIVIRIAGVLLHSVAHFQIKSVRAHAAVPVHISNGVRHTS